MRNLTEVLLGLALGLGYMTSLRFLGPIGISELLILGVILLLLKKYGLGLFRFEINLPGFIKLYFFFTLLVILPVTTLFVSYTSNLNSSPIYVISFILGGMLMFLIINALRDNFDMKVVTFWFALSFILTNIISLVLFPSALEEVRYTGAASNPNQLLFYASSVTLLLAIYHRFLAVIFIPAVIAITLKSGSDAYFLKLFVAIFSYFFLMILFVRKFSFSLNFIYSSIFLIVIGSFALINFSNEIGLLWLAADEGNLRTSLMINALIVSISSPIIGFGAGSFSGIDAPFASMEAHNTFLDLSMQFGFVFPAIIYIIFFSFLFDRIKKRQFMQASFVVGFIVSGFFHFTGRHFFFWVELAIFFYYVFYSNKSLDHNKSKKTLSEGSL